MAEKSFVLSKAHGFEAMQMGQATTQPLWAVAASLEEKIAPLLDVGGEPLEAAFHRISAASCYEKAGDLTRVVNLYHAALAGPLRDVTRKEVEGMLAACPARLKAESSPRKRRRVAPAWRGTARGRRVPTSPHPSDLGTRFAGQAAKSNLRLLFFIGPPVGGTQKN